MEVFLGAGFGIDASLSFLHVCGGVSLTLMAFHLENVFSPRMWRCFRASGETTPKCDVFSTYVEVFLTYANGNILTLSFLHVCGGVSKLCLNCIFLTSVFSTYVEVFPCDRTTHLTEPCFLHVCGGVSKYPDIEPPENMFSPRMWRCFLAITLVDSGGHVFSTYVEVFHCLCHVCRDST